MVYLTGASNAPARALAAEGYPIGLLVTPKSGYAQQLRHYRTWAADNGCFTSKDFSEDAWWAWLSGLGITGCLFATAPDVVADWPATLERSTPWLPRIRALGFPAALVAQDGATIETTPWDAFDVLFIGGTDDWKLGPDCCSLMAEAKARGKRVHVGRVNSFRRLHRSVLAGADTADGTFIAFGPDVNVPRVRHWLRRLQPVFDFGASA